MAEIRPKFQPDCFNIFFRVLARALAPRQKSEKKPSFTAEPATHSAEPATHSAVIPLNFREKWNLEKYYLRKLLNIMVMFARVRLQVVLQNVPSVVNIENQFDIV